MAKLWNKIVKNFTVKNDTFGSSSGTGSAINRDPKAIQVKRVGYQLVNGSGSAGRDNFQAPLADLNLIETAIQRDSYIMQAMMKYSELIFKSGWYFKGKNEQALLYLKTRLNMMAVATKIPTEELFQGVADDVVRYANSYLVKARTKGGVGLPPGVAATPIPPSKEPIGGYYRLPPQTITVARDEQGNIISYRQEVEGGGDPIDFKPEDIVHIAVNRPAGRPFGEPWIASVLEDVRLLRKVEENAALLLYRHIFPLLAYTVGLDKPGFEASEEEIEELSSAIENLPTDGAIVLPERHKIEAVNVSAIDGKPYLEYFEQRVFTGLGMSAVDMGRGDTANRNTADAMGGIKADRVKGWQKALQTQIDKYIIEEILVEGGFDPLSNQDFDIDFVFEEIEQERKIAKENHAILKWNSNLLTFEETRQEIGMEPVADESRLNYQMIGQVTNSTSDEVENKNTPENQNGKRSSPKKSTETVQESSHIFDLVPEKLFIELETVLTSAYQNLEKDTKEMIQAHVEKKSFPIKDPKEWLASMQFSKDKMLRLIKMHTSKSLARGINQAKEDADRNSYPGVQTKKAMRVVEEYASDSLENLEKLLRSSLKKKIEKAESSESVHLAVRGVFSAAEYRITRLSKTLVTKSYNFGYALALKKYGEEYTRSTYEGSCSVCQEKANELISLQQFSSMDEIAIFYRIPPWHPNCNCPLEYIKGGEE